MKFEVYQLTGVSENLLFKEKEKLKSLLAKSDEYRDHNLKYCVNNLDEEEGIIGGTVSQEYLSNLYTVENKIEKPIEKNPWEKTYFFIDTTSGKLLLQKRNYSAKNLIHSKTETRLLQILNDVFLTNYKSTVSIIKTSIGENNEYFKQIIKQEKVRFLKVGNLQGKKIEVGTTLHNPRVDLDMAWAESYNNYDADIIEEITIKVAEDKDINRSIIHKGTVAAQGSEIKKVSYYDEDAGKTVTITKSSVGALNVDTSANDEPVTVIQKVINKIKESRVILKKLNIKI